MREPVESAQGLQGGIIQECQSGSGAGPEKSMLNSRCQQGRRGGEKAGMRTFVCNSNITKQQITGQRS